jgi:hypothetical protein
MRAYRDCPPPPPGDAIPDGATIKAYRKKYLA